MKCPFCGTPDSRVIDTRPHDDGMRIRRRRLCDKCGMRFTTFETAERATVWVVKKDGSRQEFDPQKVYNSMVRACRKQSVSVEQLRAVVADIEKALYSSPEHEMTTVQIGEHVLSSLWDLDKVAYIRFASVYRDFTDIETFSSEINKMVKKDRRK